MDTKVYTVKGMTCNHCKHAVETALQELDGVQSATVNLELGEVSVVCSTPIPIEVIGAAIDEAGYELVTQ